MGKVVSEYNLLSYRSRFIAAVSEGLSDTEAGRTFDGEQVFAELLRELRRKNPRKARPRTPRTRVSDLRVARRGRQT